MSTFRVLFADFWSTAWGVDREALGRDEFRAVTAGAYVERHGDDRIFWFRDLTTGCRILAGSTTSLSDLCALGAKQNLVTIEDLEKILPTGWAPEFRDLDFGFLSTHDFKPRSIVPLNLNPSRDGSTVSDLRITPLLSYQSAALDDFKSQCSEDDLDTLDLTFEEDEFAFGLFEKDRLVGVSRGAPIRKMPSLVDVTVLVTPNARGYGLSTPLVSYLIEEILSRDLCPKYRVGETNVASLAIAKTLGLKALFQIVTFSRAD